ncbi:hypothetical protein DFH09DRAFT_1291328 [Mycena vulgaris]|nr:hypothetical protein DFH09DRAFT_1291328 [Mycena vulgaris]
MPSCANIEGEKSMRTRGRSVKTRGEKRKDAEERGILRPKPLDPTIRVKNMSKNRSLKNLKILRAEKSIRRTTLHASLHELPGKRCLMRYGRRLPPHILVCCSFRLRVTRTIALQLIPPSAHPNGSPSLPVYLPFYEVGRRPLGRQRWAGWEDVEGGLHKEWGRDVPESVQGRPRSSGVVTYTNAGGIRRGEGKEHAREATLKRGDGPRKRQKRSASKNEGFAPRNECRSPRQVRRKCDEGNPREHPEAAGEQAAKRADGEGRSRGDAESKEQGPRQYCGRIKLWPERKRKSQGLGSPETGVDSTKRTTTNQENIKYSKAVREVTYLDVRGISVMIRHAPYNTHLQMLRERVFAPATHMQLRRVTRKGTRRDPKRSSENDGRQPKRPGKISSATGLKANLSPPEYLSTDVRREDMMRLDGVLRDFDCKSPQVEEQERERRKSKAVIITLMRTNVPIKRTTTPLFKLRDSSVQAFKPRIL